MASNQFSICSSRKPGSETTESDVLSQNITNILPFSAMLPNFSPAANAMNVTDPLQFVDDEDSHIPGSSNSQEERRGRKNERERKRRAEVNEYFDVLATLLQVNRKNKADKTSVLQTAIDVIQAYETQLMRLASNNVQNPPHITEESSEMECLRNELAATKAQLDSKDAALERANDEISQLRTQLEELSASQSMVNTKNVPVLPTVPKPEAQSLAAALESIARMPQASEVHDLPQAFVHPLVPIKEESTRKSASQSSHRLCYTEHASIPPTKRLHRVSPKSSLDRYSHASTGPQTFSTSPSIGSLTEHFKDVQIKSNNSITISGNPIIPSKLGLSLDSGNPDPTPPSTESMIIKELDDSAVDARASFAYFDVTTSNPFNLPFDVGLPIEEIVSDPELLPQKVPSFSNLQIPEFFNF